MHHGCLFFYPLSEAIGLLKRNGAVEGDLNRQKTTTKKAFEKCSVKWDCKWKFGPYVYASEIYHRSLYPTVLPPVFTRHLMNPFSLLTCLVVLVFLPYPTWSYTCHIWRKCKTTSTQIWRSSHICHLVWRAVSLILSLSEKHDVFPPCSLSKHLLNHIGIG